MKHACILMALALMGLAVETTQAQVVWTDRSSEFDLPDGVRIWTGTRGTPAEYLTRVEADLGNPAISVQAYHSPTYKTTTTFSRDVGAIASINGGFFSATGSVSTVVFANELVVATGQTLNRDGQNYPLTRAFFAMLPDGSPRIDWIYHFGNAMADMYRYDAVAPNQIGSPAATPTREGGTRFDEVLNGVGGGPNLVSNGQVHVTYDEEVFFGGSGLEGGSNRARSAVGITADNKVVFLAADTGVLIPSDFTFSAGVTLNRMAEILVSLGVVEGMNLDGGGSTAVAVRGTLASRPSGGTTQRPVPTILSVVYADSVERPAAPLPETVLDTEFAQQVSISGAGWFQSANPGYFGESRAWLHPKGDGSASITYAPQLQRARHEVYGWWVAANNRTTDTPFVVVHRNGRDTVRVNQQATGSQWVRLGEWEFSGTPADQVIISNAAAGGPEPAYVVADALRFVQTGPTDTSTEDSGQWTAPRYELLSNYPNPFNPTTLIRFRLDGTSHVRLSVHDVLGREVAVLVNGAMPGGTHEATFDATGLATGLYVYRLTTPATTTTRTMTLIR